MEKINAKLAVLSLATLKDMAIKLNNDFRAEADIVQSAVMNRLMAIMPESAFVAFCEELEA